MNVNSNRNFYSRWLITGGCGFIGTSLIRNLMKERGQNIRILDNLSVGTKNDLESVCDFNEITLEEIEKTGQSEIDKSGKSIVELVKGDIVEKETAMRSVRGRDVIVHLAANTGVGPSVKNPRKDLETNIIGTFNMLEAARYNNIQKFIFASSGAPVGECEPPINEDIAPHPVSPYGASKLAGEGYCSVYNKTFNIQTVALRFGNVYGPGSGHKNSVIAKFIKEAMNGKPLEIYGDGSQTRDFIYIEDLVDAIKKAVNHSNLNFIKPGQRNKISSSKVSNNNYFIGGEVFQIATNSETTIREVIDIMVPILNNVGVKNLKVTNGKKRIGDVARNYSDTSKAKKILGWYAKTNLQEGLTKTVAWFMKK